MFRIIFFLYILILLLQFSNSFQIVLIVARSQQDEAEKWKKESHNCKNVKVYIILLANQHMSTLSHPFRIIFRKGFPAGIFLAAGRYPAHGEMMTHRYGQSVGSIQLFRQHIGF